MSENGSVLIVVNNFDVVILGVQNGTEIFVAQYAGESLDLVKIGKVIFSLFVSGGVLPLTPR